MINLCDSRLYPAKSLSANGRKSDESFVGQLSVVESRKGRGREREKERGREGGR